MATFDDFGTTERSERQLADLEQQLNAPQTPTEADPGLFVRKDTLAAKGDLYIATAAAAIGRQASSNSNGDTLQVDTSTTTGWKVAAPVVPTAFTSVAVSASGRLSLKVTTPAQIVANTNNYNPGTGSFFRVTTDASRNITGIVAGADGDVIILRNAGGFDFVLTNQDASSTAANRIVTGTGASVTYPPDDTALLVYDIITARWVAIL